jgi:hypothetical protein
MVLKRMWELDIFKYNIKSKERQFYLLMHIGVIFNLLKINSK